MTLEELLLPNEEIRYRQKIKNFKVGGKSFDELLVTDKRLIFYTHSGLIFKKDISQTIGLSSINGIKFNEKGIIRKKGNIEIHGSVKLKILGKLDDARHLHQVLLEKIE